MIAVFLVIIIVFGVLVLVVLSRVSKRFNLRQPKLNHDYFQEKWGELLLRVRTPEGMILAVIDADKLLDDALKKRHFRGKTMGARLVAAQRTLTDNDAVWYAHKLRNRLVHEPDVKLHKGEAMRALEGFRKGFRDLGAF